MPRDRLQNSLRRVHSKALHNAKIEVYEPTTSYSQGDGWDVSYPAMPTTYYEARVDEPTSDANRERSGTTAEIDVVIIVRDDTGQQWTGFGDKTEASSRVLDPADGTLYEVQDVVDAHNGTIELEATEV